MAIFMSNVQANPTVTFSMTITEVLPLRLLVPNIIAQLVAAVFATMTAQIIRQDLRQGFTSMDFEQEKFECTTQSATIEI